MLGQAVKWRLLAANPAQLASPPAVPQVHAKAPSIVEAFRLIAAARHEPWPQLLTLALVSGLRRSEILALRWNDLDLEQGWITIEQVVEQVGRDFAIRPVPKTKTSARRIGLDQEACAMLKVWRTRLAEQVLRLGLRWESTALVFPNLASGCVTTPRSPDTVSATASKLAKRAGLPPGVAALHGLRHRHASSLITHLPLKLISDRLGHSTIRITSDLYVHGDEATARTAADAAGKVFGAVVRLVDRKLK
jgi:integrase